MTYEESSCSCIAADNRGRYGRMGAIDVLFRVPHHVVCPLFFALLDGLSASLHEAFALPPGPLMGKNYNYNGCTSGSA